METGPTESPLLPSYTVIWTQASPCRTVILSQSCHKFNAERRVITNEAGLISCYLERLERYCVSRGSIIMGNNHLMRNASLELYACKRTVHIVHKITKQLQKRYIMGWDISVSHLTGLRWSEKSQSWEKPYLIDSCDLLTRNHPSFCFSRQPCLTSAICLRRNMNVHLENAAFCDRFGRVCFFRNLPKRQCGF